MSIFRRTALKTVERGNFDGNYFDSITHAKMFGTYKPYDMGVKSAKLFSSDTKSELVNKKFTYYTVAMGNTFMLPGGVDDYSWKLVSDVARTFKITKVYATPNNQPGKGGAQFKIAVDSPGLMEPVLLKTVDPNAPRLRIIGQSKQVGANQHELVVELQDSNKNSWVKPSLLQVGQELVDCGTSVADEANQKYGGDYFDDMFKLQGVVGVFARKASFTDKFIRTEIACKKEGRSMTNGSYTIGNSTITGGAIGHGYVYQSEFRGHGGKMIEKGVFITNIEARLEDRLMNDREMSFEFGRLQIDRDPDTARTRKDPAGWREIVKEGHYFAHNGNLTLNQIEDWLTNVFATRKNFSDRKIKLATGEGGIKFINRLIRAEASAFTVIDDNKFIRSRTDGGSGFHSNELVFGAQFTKLLLDNGIEIELVYDPIKDDPSMFPQKAPGSYHSIESYSFDVFDFGVTDQTPAGAATHQNMTAIMQDGVELYYHLEGSYSFANGAINDGSVRQSSSKELEILRETTGALGVFDVSRVGRMEYVPGYAA